MKAHKLPDGSLERSQKRKTGQYLKNAAIVGGGVAAVLAVLLYGRASIFSEPAPRENATPQDVHGAQEAAREQQEALRAQFRERMSFYERTAKPQIAALNLSGWARQEPAALEAGEREAVAAFAGGNFAIALDRINQLIARVPVLQKEHEAGFNRAVQQARQGVEDGHSERALTAIDRALLYRPDDLSAAGLKGRISVMQDVAAFVDAADTARIEGRLDREISLLAQAVSLDPGRSDLVARHRLLIAEQRALNFDALVRAGWAAIERRDAGQARTNLNKAARIFPDRKELGLLSTAIKKSERESIYKSLINKAQAARSNDDWPSATVHYVDALKIFPHSGEVAADLELSRRITHQTQRLESVLRQPQRLSDARVAGIAGELVEESRQLADQSPKLRRLAEQVAYAIKQALTPVAVFVYSDNQTHVSVLGVGVIGQIREYRLKEGLKPGNYTFKGERKGFKDKLVQVQVRRGEVVKVRVVCDEPI